jgi:hypothetical protein
MKKRAYDIATHISNLAEVNPFENTRQREYVEARALICLIFYKYLNISLTKIARFFQSNGKHMNHATVLYMIKNYDTYKFYNKNLDKWLDMVINEIDDVGNENKRTLIIHRIKYLTTKDIDELALYTEDMYNKVLQKEETF